MLKTPGGGGARELPRRTTHVLCRCQRISSAVIPLREGNPPWAYQHRLHEQPVLSAFQSVYKRITAVTMTDRVPRVLVNHRTGGDPNTFRMRSITLSFQEPEPRVCISSVSESQGDAESSFTKCAGYGLEHMTNHPGAMQTARCVKQLRCRPDNLNSISSTHGKSQMQWHKLVMPASQR